jgi:hypothetical protein
MQDKARILRWDRLGMIVTESINFNNEPLLAEFFRCYSKVPPEMHGTDQSVSDPMPEEAIAAGKALELADNIPLFKLEVPCNNGVPHYFITGSPRPIFYTPPGRATRGFQAYDISGATLVFLKDTWRIDLPSIPAEGSTYNDVLQARQHAWKCTDH